MKVGDALRLFVYCPETGDLKWRVNRQGHVKAGDSAGTIHKNGFGKSYRSVKVSGKHYLIHRVCWLYSYGKFPDGCIDHLNGDGLDNRLSNLRDVTRSENQRNMRISSRSKTGVMGVIWDKRSRRWHVRIAKNGDTKRSKHIGYFKDFFEAVCARKSAEIKFGYHINHGENRPL